MLHDARKVPRTRMDGAITAILNLARDLRDPSLVLNEGMRLLLADRAEKIAAELKTFDARDLIRMRRIEGL